MNQNRIRQRSSRDTEGDAQRILGKLEATGRDLRIVRLVANWSAGLRPFVLSSDALLFRGALDPHVREIIVLYIAARLGNDYEWDEHVPMSERAGVTDAERAALRAAVEGSDEPILRTTFDPVIVDALELATSLLSDSTVDLDAWDRACESLGRESALEILFVVAWWGAYVPLIANTLLSLEQPPSP